MILMKNPYEIVMYYTSLENIIFLHSDTISHCIVDQSFSFIIEQVSASLGCLLKGLSCILQTSIRHLQQKRTVVESHG